MSLQQLRGRITEATVTMPKASNWQKSALSSTWNECDKYSDISVKKHAVTYLHCRSWYHVSCAFCGMRSDRCKEIETPITSVLELKCETFETNKIKL